MKLLITQDALINAGTERSNLELISRFSGDIEAVLVYFYPKHELKEEYSKAGIRLFFLDIPEKYHLILAVRKLVKFIQTEKPDLLVSSLWRADIITRIASWITGVPVVGTLVNDSYSEFAWKDKSGWKHQVVYWLDRLTAKIPVHWIANAQALVESHHKTLGLPPNKVTVVYRGREIPVLRSLPAPQVDGSPQTESTSPRSLSPQTGIYPTNSPPWSVPARPSGGFPQTELTGSSSPRSVSSQTGITNSSPRPVSSQTEITGSLPRSVSPQPEISGSLPRSVSPQTGKTSSTHSSPAGIPIRNFISYGRLLERKGFQDAIQAFAKVIQSYPNCTLTIFGEGPYRKELEKLIEGLQLQNAVFLPGKIYNPMEVLLNGYFLPESSNWQKANGEGQLANGNQQSTTDNRQQPSDNLQPTTDPNPEPALHRTSDIGHRTTAHCFLFPSWYEGFSGALVEAMMAGMPIIASDIPMNLEAVEDQKSALIFPVGDIEHLEEKMRHAIEHPAWMESLGQEARRVAIQKFDIEKIAQQYENTLKEIYRQIK